MMKIDPVNENWSILLGRIIAHSCDCAVKSKASCALLDFHAGFETKKAWHDMYLTYDWMTHHQNC